ncbi:MAG: RNA polymerase subunit sigma [Candidatus Cloacimonetes bacterium 4572_65]|nr:MAG: RNA polymerase subunit sigma [Candidatus Cloacimonetes bacterium 4572_65]
MSENVFSDKALQSYLNQISKFETFSREEENRLAVLARDGSQDAIDKLLQANLKFVVKIAAKYQNRGLTLSELISAGNLGLLRAVQKFDPEQDIKLISYAIWWIKQKIMQAVAERSSLIKVPLGKINTAYKLKSTTSKIYTKTGHKATIKELSEKTNINEKTIKKLKHQIVTTFSMDSKTPNGNDDNATLSDFITHKISQDPQSIYYKEQIKNEISKAINSLNEREKFIINSYFGLNDNDSENFAEIAGKMGLSRERVRQLQIAALEKIRVKIADHKEKFEEYFKNQDI